MRDFDFTMVNAPPPLLGPCRGGNGEGGGGGGSSGGRHARQAERERGRRRKRRPHTVVENVPHVCNDQAGRWGDTLKHRQQREANISVVVTSAQTSKY